MVQLREVRPNDKSVTIAQLRKVERDDELQSKFSRLADEDQMVRKLEANSARVNKFFIFFMYISKCFI